MIKQRDRDILRRLAEEQASIAALPCHSQTIEAWTRLNDLDPIKPMIWINEIPWHEMNVNDELTLLCQNPILRQHEQTLRRTLYQWRHMPGDMVIEPVHYVSLCIHDTGLGMDEDVDIVRTDVESNIVSRHFHEQITCLADIERIQNPVVSHDKEITEAHHTLLDQTIGDILPVVKRGIPGSWFAPWDELIRWWGVEQAMQDLILRPDLVHAAMDRLMDAYCSRLDQWEQLNLLARNGGNVRIGSGGLGYTNSLPGSDHNGSHPKAHNLWGSATAQIFSDVSPRMHQEFALDYERRWTNRFGLVYYGCCEPLDRKVDMLAQMPNLRKISMSPWVNLERAVKAVDNRYVFSRKPNPAIFAEDTFNPARAREELTTVLDRGRGCSIEIIMKDISTVRHDPRRLWHWADIAKRISNEYADQE